MNSPTRTIYSLYYPETRSIVESLWNSNPHQLYEKSYTKHQDKIHSTLLSSWKDWIKLVPISLPLMSFEYPTAGASEGINAVIAYYATHNYNNIKRRIHVLNGEYEGYEKIAQSFNVDVIYHTKSDLFDSNNYVDGDVFFISQPSAIDGCVWNNFDFWCSWMSANYPNFEIVVDLTYVGTVAKEMNIDLTHNNIKVILWSLSKPFGVYYHRIGGLLSKFEIKSLYGNFWFKNLFSIKLGTELIKSYGPYDLPRKYISFQNKIIELLNNSDLVPSDVILIAKSKNMINAPDCSSHLNDFYRACSKYNGILRYCLTPIMDEMVNL